MFWTMKIKTCKLRTLTFNTLIDIYMCNISMKIISQSCDYFIRSMRQKNQISDNHVLNNRVLGSELSPSRTLSRISKCLLSINSLAIWNFRCKIYKSISHHIYITKRGRSWGVYNLFKFSILVNSVINLAYQHMINVLLGKVDRTLNPDQE